MSKIYGLFIALFLVSLNAQAYEPVLDQQGMLYFNLSYDIGQSKKTDHEFGFRFDRSFVEPHETLTMNQLNAQSAVFDVKINDNGLKAFNIHGVDYSYATDIYQAAEGEAAEPKRDLKIPLGVIIGVLIGTLALMQ